MGLQDVAKSAAKAGFNVAGDLKRSVTLVDVTGTSYDPDTGETTEATNAETIDFLLGQFTAKEVFSGQVEAQDIKIKVQQADLSFDISVVDRAEIDGDTYQIVKWNQDGAQTMYFLHLRK